MKFLILQRGKKRLAMDEKLFFCQNFSIFLSNIHGVDADDGDVVFPVECCFYRFPGEDVRCFHIHKWSVSANLLDLKVISPNRAVETLQTFAGRSETMMNVPFSKYSAFRIL